MWSTPRSGSVYVPPEEDIEANTGRQYLVRPLDIHDEGVSQFADPADSNPSHNIRWTFSVHDPETRVAMLNTEGTVFEHTDYTSSRTGRGRSQTAKARDWMEALMGRELADEEINDDLTPQLLKCAAVAIFETKQRTSRTGETYDKLFIEKLYPYRAPKRAAQPAAPRPAPAARAAAPAELPVEESVWP